MLKRGFALSSRSFGYAHFAQHGHGQAGAAVNTPTSWKLVAAQHGQGVVYADRDYPQLMKTGAVTSEWYSPLYLSVCDCRKALQCPSLQGVLVIERHQFFEKEEEIWRGGLRRVAVPSIPYPAASGAERTFRDGSLLIERPQSFD